MTHGMLFLLQETHAPAAGPASPFDVNFGLFLWTWVVFLILLWVLWKFAWPGILKATEEREKKIRDQLAEAERLNSEAKATLAEAHQREVDARNSAQQLLAEARAAVDKERASAVDKVRNEQEAVLARTRLDIATERPGHFGSRIGKPNSNHVIVDFFGRVVSRFGGLCFFLLFCAVGCS